MCNSELKKVMTQSSVLSPVRIALFSLCLVLFLVPGILRADGRVALLIGNSSYGTPEMDLINPVNDVERLGEALRSLGFAVTEITDQTNSQMQDALDTFAVSAQGAEIALFFFAGHGVQIAGENYLVGSEFGGADVDSLRRASLQMSRVRDVLDKADPDIGILMLDACRNNPFTDSGLVAEGLVRSSGGAGILVAYATDPGNVAYDGDGENSVFTAALLDHIGTPGLDARLMLGRVRQQVVMQTGGQQIPWVEEAVLGEHVFAPGDPGALPSDDTVRELARWRAISGSLDPERFEAYLEEYPKGLFSDFARNRVDMLRTASRMERAGNETVETLLASADPTQLSAALTTLGLMTPTRTRAVPEQLRPALQGYQSQIGDPTDLDEEQLYTDAARVAMFLAATTLQRIRTDIVALRSVDRTLNVARTALGQIEQIAETNADALPILQAARNDIADIETSRAVVLSRLDESRSYYDEVLQRAVAFFPEGATTSLIGSEERSRDLGQSGGQMLQDAQLFINHVGDADEAKEGSYQWLTDVLPEQ